MQISYDTDTFTSTVGRALEGAGRVIVKTVNGDEFEVYEPIALGGEYLSFSEDSSKKTTVIVPIRAIASFRFPR